MVNIHLILFIILLIICHIVSAVDDSKRSPGAQKLLEKHRVSKSTTQEIVRMSAQNIPKETIVQHMQTHFPGKSSGDINNIIVAAHLAHGKPQPKRSDLKRK